MKTRTINKIEYSVKDLWQSATKNGLTITISSDYCGVNGKWKFLIKGKVKEDEGDWRISTYSLRWGEIVRALSDALERPQKEIYILCIHAWIAKYVVEGKS